MNKLNMNVHENQKHFQKLKIFNFNFVPLGTNRK